MKAKINQILEAFRDFVATHEDERPSILTAYVNVDPSDPENQKQRPAWLIALKNEAKRIESELGPDELKRWDSQRRWATTEELIRAHLTERKPSGRSVVLFTAGEDLVGVDVPVELPTRLYYGTPQLKHLLFALDQYKKYLVILFAASEVRLVEVFLARTTDELLIESDVERLRKMGRKADTLAKERRDSEYERRYVRESVEEINQHFLGDTDFERIVFGANAKIAHAVRNALHPAVQPLVVAIEAIDFKLPYREVADRVRTIAERHEEEHDVAVVEQLVAKFNRRGPAVVERQAVEAALRDQNVRTLIIPYPIDSDEFDALIEDVVLAGADVEFVYGRGATKLKEVGGIGAVLHYSER